APGQPVDPVTLWPAIQADPQLSRSIKSAAMLHDLMEATPTAANAGYYGRQVAEAGQNRRLNNAGERLQQLSEAADMPAGEKLTLARKELDAIASGYAGQASAPTLAEILSVPDAEIDWVIPGLLASRDRLVLTGAEGLGKTTFFRQMLILAAAGIHPVEFKPMDPLTALVVDTENSEDQWRWETRDMAGKAARYGTANPGDNVRIYCTGRLNIASEKDLAQVHTLL